MANQLDPEEAGRLIGYFESGDDYSAGYSKKSGDITRYPPRPGYYGFPDWPGEMGPAGITHAAGRYQFQPDTWKQYAGPLGINDFSPESQDRVFKAAYADKGLAPWLPYNPRLASAVNQLGGGQPIDLIGNAGKSSGPGLNVAGGPLNPIQVSAEATPAEKSPPLFPVTPPDAPSGPNLGSMLALLALSSAGSYKFIPVDYDPFVALPGGRPSGYTSKVGKGNVRG